MCRIFCHHDGSIKRKVLNAEEDQGKGVGTKVRREKTREKIEK